MTKPAKITPVSNPMLQIPFQSTSLDIWDTKYRLKNKDGSIIDQDMDETYQRVAKALAEVELNPNQKEIIKRINYYPMYKFLNGLEITYSWYKNSQVNYPA